MIFRLTLPAAPLLHLLLLLLLLTFSLLRLDSPAFLFQLNLFLNSHSTCQVIHL